MCLEMCQGMCLEIHRKELVVVAREATITECWSQETELDQQGVEIQRTRKRVRGKGKQKGKCIRAEWQLREGQGGPQNS